MPFASDDVTPCRARRDILTWSLGVVLYGLYFIVGLMLSAAPAGAQVKAQAATGLPYQVAVFLSSNPENCFASPTDDAIRKLVARQQQQINSRGGIGGRPVEVTYFDDTSDDSKTAANKVVANMHKALALPELIGMIGLTSSNRGSILFKEVGEAIGKSKVPYVTDMSVNNLFANLPNVFSTRPSQEEGNAPVVIDFIKASGFRRVALIVNTEAVYSKTFGDAVAAGLGAEIEVVANEPVPETSRRTLDADALGRAIAKVGEVEPDLVVVAVGSRRTGIVLEALRAGGKTPPVMMMGSLEIVEAASRDSYPEKIYELTTSDLPEVTNTTLGNVISSGEPGEWIFPQEKQDTAAGWKDGSCEKEREADINDPLEFRNRRAIERGTQFADMLSLIARVADSTLPTSSIEDRRKAVVDAMTDSYAAGRGAFRGDFNTWSFDPKTRVAVRPRFVVVLPTDMRPRSRQLAPVQFLRLRDASLRKIDTLYVDIDLIRAHGIDDNAKTFLADFYLAMRANDGADVDRLDFTNAYVDPRTNGRQIRIEELHDGSADPAFPDDMKIYRVSGRFLFKPDLGAYPFDTQRFAIDIKPKARSDGRSTRGGAFLVQPPPDELRDKDVQSDDWQWAGQYVGLSEDFVPIVDAYRHVPSVVPFYNASFVWLMKREVRDYFLRVVIPLAFILIVSYISVFIPRGHFEAIVTIQVTALLSAVALYLSLPQLDSDTATLSDRIFLYYYMIISVMILISILRIHPWVAPRRLIRGLFGFIHIVGTPAFVAWIAWHIYMLSQAA